MTSSPSFTFSEMVMVDEAVDSLVRDGGVEAIDGSFFITGAVATTAGEGDVTTAP
jgi:hypothetical protein